MNGRGSTISVSEIENKMETRIWMNGELSRRGQDKDNQKRIMVKIQLTLK